MFPLLAGNPFDPARISSCGQAVLWVFFRRVKPHGVHCNAAVRKAKPYVNSLAGKRANLISQAVMFLCPARACFSRPVPTQDFAPNTRAMVLPTRLQFMVATNSFSISRHCEGLQHHSSSQTGQTCYKDLSYLTGPVMSRDACFLQPRLEYISTLPKKIAYTESKQQEISM
jgi:hypothetical protein